MNRIVLVITIVLAGVAIVAFGLYFYSRGVAEPTTSGPVTAPVDTVIDNDGDGLTDFVEINTYGSDPLNPDTDGDGFLDGAEVQNGYSPTGPGRL